MLQIFLIIVFHNKSITETTTVHIENVSPECVTWCKTQAFSSLQIWWFVESLCSSCLMNLIGICLFIPKKNLFLHWLINISSTHTHTYVTLSWFSFLLWLYQLIYLWDSLSQSQLSPLICVQFTSVCVLNPYYVCDTLFFPSCLVHRGPVWLAGASVRKFSSRKPTWISFRAASRGGLGLLGWRREHTSLWPTCFQLKGWLYLAISGREGEWSSCPRWGDQQVSSVIMRKGELFASPPLPHLSFHPLISSGKCVSAFAFECEHSCNSFCLFAPLRQPYICTNVYLQVSFLCLVFVC